MSTDARVSEISQVFTGISGDLEGIPDTAVDAFFTSAPTNADQRKIDAIADQISYNALARMASCFRQWHNAADAAAGTNFWAVLAEHGCPYRSLVVALHSAAGSHKRGKSAEQGARSLAAATAYACMVQIPGNFNVVHAMAARASLNAFRGWVKYKQAPAARREREEASIWDDKRTAEQAPEFLVALERALRTAALSDDVVSYAVEVLLDATRCVYDNSAIETSVYRALAAPLQGPGRANIAWVQILRGLKDNILMSFSGFAAALKPRQLQRVRAMALDFVKSNARRDKSLERAVLVLVHHISYHCSDRADARASAVDAAVSLLLAFPSLVRARDFCTFVELLSRNARAGRRMLAVELAGRAVCEPSLFADAVTTAGDDRPFTPVNGASEGFAFPEEDTKQGEEAKTVESKAEADDVRTDDGDQTSAGDDAKTQSEEPMPARKQAYTLLAVIQARCSDKAANVRTSALNVLGRVIRATPSNVFLSTEFHKLFDGSEAQHVATTPAAETDKTSSFALFPMRPSSGRNPSKLACSPFTPQRKGVQQIVKLLQRRSADARPGVRKAAVGVLEALLTCDPETSGRAGSGLLSEGALQALYDSCMDASVSVRKQGMASLTALASCYPRDAVLRKIWLGAVLPLALDPEVTVQSLAMRHIREGILDPVVAAAPRRGSKAGEKADPDSPVWQTLEALDDSMLRYLQQALATMFAREETPRGFVPALQRSVSGGPRGVWVLLKEASKHCPKRIDARKSISQWTDLHSKRNELDGWDFAFAAATHVVANVAPFCAAPALIKVGRAMLQDLSGFRLPLRVCAATVRGLTQISNCVTATAGDAGPLESWEDKVIRACCATLKTRVQKGTTGASDKVVRALFSLGEVTIRRNPDQDEVKTASDAATLVQALAQPASGGGDTSVRAHAFTALGKLCLRSRKLTRATVPVFIRELRTGACPVVRNNVLVVLCDLCRTFTSSVDGQMDAVTACLRDENEVVRRHSLMILVQLLQEDYIKWKGSMFFRALRAVVDQDTGVRLYARGALTQLIVAKWPRQLHRHFVEALFYYNGCTKHRTYNKYGADEDRFAMTGPRGRAGRFQLYEYMLGFMQDEHKFNTTCKLCQDVLGAVVDGDLPLTGEGSDAVASVIKDALLILAGKSIKLRVTRAPAGDADVEDERAKKMRMARGKIMSKLVKKNAMENIVPLLIELKRQLERTRSPLLRFVMLYLQELLGDYRDEVDEILVADPQLAAEIKYDLARFAERESRVRSAQDMANIGSITTPITNMPAITPHKQPAPSMLDAKSPVASKPRPFSTPRLKEKKSAVAVSRAETKSRSPTVNLDVDVPRVHVFIPFNELSPNPQQPQASEALVSPNKTSKKRSAPSPAYNAVVEIPPASKAGKIDAAVARPRGKRTSRTANLR